MGSRDWLKNIVSLKKAKDNKSKKLKGSLAPEKSNGYTLALNSQPVSSESANGASVKYNGISGMSAEDRAATQIQTAFRAYKARKAFRRLIGIARLQALTQGHSVKKQASTTLSYLHSWSRIQAQIRARRIRMVVEGRLRQKKLESQLKLEAKLHDLEVEWNSGSETMEDVLARMHQREEAAVKRERTLAYAFSHQWRPNSNSGLGNPEVGKANWGWSWTDRWIAARPWESRVPVQSSPKKGQSRQNRNAIKKMNSPTTKIPVKTISPNGKGATKARRLSYEAAVKTNSQNGEGKPETAGVKKDISVS